MLIYGQGNEGRIVNNVTTSAALPTATPGIARGIAFIPEVGRVSVQTVISALIGGFTATLTIEASNNYAPVGSYMGQMPNAGDWADVTAQFTGIVAITANGTQMANAASNGWRAIRVNVTRTAGTSAVVDVWVQGKE